MLALCLAITWFLMMLEVQYDIKVKAIKCNNKIIEIYLHIAKLLTDWEILIEPLALNT